MQHKWHIRYWPRAIPLNEYLLNVISRLRWVHSTQFDGNWTHIGWDMDLWSWKSSAPNPPGANIERCRGPTCTEIGSRVDLYACVKIVKVRARKWAVFWHRYWQNSAKKVPCADGSAGSPSCRTDPKPLPASLNSYAEQLIQWLSHDWSAGLGDIESWPAAETTKLYSWCDIGEPVSAPLRATVNYFASAPSVDP